MAQEQQQQQQQQHRQTNQTNQPHQSKQSKQHNQIPMFHHPKLETKSKHLPMVSRTVEENPLPLPLFRMHTNQQKKTVKNQQHLLLWLVSLTRDPEVPPTTPRNKASHLKNISQNRHRSFPQVGVNIQNI